MVTWSVMQQTAISDPEYAALLHAVGAGDSAWGSGLTEYKRFATDLSVLDGVVMYRGRVVVPTVLRGEVLAALHKAHQGSTSMALRAGDTVWWPGLSRDLVRMREGCTKCVQNAPSQPASQHQYTHQYQHIPSSWFHRIILPMGGMPMLWW